MIVRVRRYSNQQLIDLSHQIGEGGEGTVYCCPDNTQEVAKIYKEQPLSTQQIEKLNFIINNPPNIPGIIAGQPALAWPNDLLLDPYSNRAVGFVMPNIDAPPIVDFYNPSSRPRSVTFRFAHRAAHNLAVAVNSLHRRGYVIGDLNHRNVKVSRQNLVTIIDIDSIQVRTTDNLYLCPVGHPEYTPREMFGRPFRETPRTPAQDNFSLGILMYQLLMQGYHPFSGRLPRRKPGDLRTSSSNSLPKFYDLIDKGWFCADYSMVNQWIPPIGMPSFDILLPQIQHLFRRCFIEGHADPKIRPTAREWMTALRQIDDARCFTVCGRHRSHVYYNHLERCPWCAMRFDPYFSAQNPSNERVSSKLIAERSSGQNTQPQNTQQPAQQSVQPQDSPPLTQPAQNTPPANTPVGNVPAGRRPELIVAADGSGQFLTIGAALAHARNHAIVRIRAGHYNEPLQISRSITLVGDPGAVLFTNAQSAIEIVDVSAEVHLENLRVERIDEIGKRPLVLATNSKRISLQKCALYARRSSAMVVAAPGSKTEVLECTVEGDGDDIIRISGAQSSVVINSCYIGGRAREGVFVHSTARDCTVRLRRCRIVDCQRCGVRAAQGSVDIEDTSFERIKRDIIRAGGEIRIA